MHAANETIARWLRWHASPFSPIPKAEQTKSHTSNGMCRKCTLFPDLNETIRKNCLIDKNKARQGKWIGNAKPDETESLII